MVFLLSEAKSKVNFWVKSKVLHELPCSSCRHIKAAEAQWGLTRQSHVGASEGGAGREGVRWDENVKYFVQWASEKQGNVTNGWKCEHISVFFFLLTKCCVAFTSVISYFVFDISYTNNLNTCLTHNLLQWFSDVPAALITGAFKQWCLKLQLCRHESDFYAVPKINKRKWLLIVLRVSCAECTADVQFLI